MKLPVEAAFFRVRRDTGGRPRHVNGPDMKPLTLPLDYSPEDLLNLVGRGSYRLDLCDDSGQHLETVTVKLGPSDPEPRNRASEIDDAAVPTAMLPAIGSDVRLVLEANVRATQLAFLHNERTLAASLKIAETLRDGVQVLAESQADWIKSLASSRGFYRNAAPPSHLPPPRMKDDEDDGHEDGDDDLDVDDDDDVSESKSWAELLAPTVTQLAETATTFILAKTTQKTGAPASSPPTATRVSDTDDLAARGFEARASGDTQNRPVRDT